jgi:hypothetical protein
MNDEIESGLIQDVRDLEPEPLHAQKSDSDGTDADNDGTDSGDADGTDSGDADGTDSGDGDKSDNA